ncbi:hypothetical protein F4808DRAFT_361900 [Astrocystis sublimbata]|nr:hypothetical protein F4808DRAFT_361900 [Astrocystis sublimbata]
MYKNNAVVLVAALAGTSLAQSTTPSKEECQSTLVSFAMGGSPPVELLPYLTPLSYIPTGAATGTVMPTPMVRDTLADPEKFQSVVCSIAAELPSSLLPVLGSWGAELISYGSVHISGYDRYITECVTTGPKATSIISYLNNMLTGTDPLCPALMTPPAATGTGSMPTPTITGTGSMTITASASGSMIPTAAAAPKPTGLIAGAVAVGGLVGVLQNM